MHGTADDSVRSPEDASTEGAVTAPSLVDTIPSSTALLIAGPPLTGKYQLMLELLAARSDRAIFVTTKHQADRVRSDFQEFAPDVPDEDIGVVDCVSHHERIGRVEDSETVKYVSSPENLTRIGVQYTELADLFQERDEGRHAGVGVHSLSNLVMHSSMQQVYQFLQVLTGQIRGMGWLGVAVIEQSVTDDDQLQTLQHHFDGLVETRENDDGHREFRIRGLTPKATDWTAF